MKKNYLKIFVALAVLSGAVQAQVASMYTFSQYSGTFVPITGGTVYGTTSSDDQTFTDPGAPAGSPNTGPGIPIGFTFMFNNNLFDCIGINNNGWIGFGHSSLNPAVNISNTGSNYTGISSASAAAPIYQNRVAVLARDIQAQAGASIRVETIGSSPNRTCVVQFLNYKKFGTGGTGDNFNFQIRLIETTNEVEIVYGTFVNGTTAGTAEVGLRGNSNADYNNRIVTTTDPWNASIPGTANNSVVNFNNSGLVPASGQSYRWTPPQCSGSLSGLTAVAIPTMVCPNAGADILVVGMSTLSGLTYTWYESVVSAVGTWTLIPNANGPVYGTPGVTVTTWYRAEVNCLHSASTATTSAAEVQVAPTTTNSVPYFEDFEGITVGDLLPNCSWSASGLGTTFQTYTTSASNNRVPLSGSNFGAFVAPTATAYVYTNGIFMQPGITYSAAIHYATDYSGAVNWTDLAILIGDAQNINNLSLLKEVKPAVSGPYKLLSDTFQVSAPGFYYLAIRAIGGTGGAPYLMIDDVSVTIPCQPGYGNQPTISIATGTAPACLGQPIILAASGAHVFHWSDNSTGPVVSHTPGMLGTNTVVVAGTDTITKCASTASVLMNVHPAPQVNASALPGVTCAGKNVLLTASGADNFDWTTGGQGAQQNVTPQQTTTYIVVGSNTTGCTGSATLVVNVSSNPTITAGVSTSTICTGEEITLSASGADAFIWSSLNTPLLMQGSQVTFKPSAGDVFIVTGTNANGCQSTGQVSFEVDACAGIAEFGATGNMRIWPNPASTAVTVQAPGATSLVIHDLTGRVVSEIPFTGNTLTVDLTDLAKGVYVIRVENANASTSARLVIE